MPGVLRRCDGGSNVHGAHAAFVARMTSRVAPMRPWFVGSVLAWSACAAPEAPAPEPRAARSLFDGRTLDGWEGDPGFWRVEDGAIVGESSAANPCAETTYL